MSFLQQGRDTDFLENYITTVGRDLWQKLCQRRRGQVRLDLEEQHQCVIVKLVLQIEVRLHTRILVLVSHSQDFFNSVCTNIIHVHERKLKYYGGNYDSYVRTRAELEENQMKQYQWEQDQFCSHEGLHCLFRSRQCQTRSSGSE